MWIGSKSLIDTLGGFAAMMGGPAVSAPADPPPVAMAATGDAGGAQLRIVVPTKVITTVQEIGKRRLRVKWVAATPWMIRANPRKRRRTAASRNSKKNPEGELGAGIHAAPKQWVVFPFSYHPRS